jgi:peptidylglycine monooxygenase
MNAPLFVALGPQRYRVERPWGEVPSGPGRVSDVACGLDRKIYVLTRKDAAVDPPGNSVFVLNAEGQCEAAWGAEIVDGHMLGCGSDGTIGVVDRDAHEVVMFDAAGRRVGALGQRHQPGTPFNHPTDVTFARNGDIFVADGYGASVVHRFHGDRRVGAWGTPGDGAGQFTTPHAVCTLHDGRVAVADRENHRVQIFSPEGAWLASWRDHHKPMALATDAAGNLLVTDQIPRLSLLSPSGELLGRCRPVLNGAHGMACGRDGVIYLAEINPSRITRLVPC